MKFKFILLAGLSLILVWGCKPNAPGDETQTNVKVKVPRFEMDSAYAYVAKQLEFGPRVMNSEGHEACKNWLVNKLKSFGAKVTEQHFQAKTYNGLTVNGTNITGSYNPESRTRILLAAHWDSRHIADSPLSTERRDEPILGADDGASGVGVLLEVARQLQQNPISIGVDIVLFDAEDYGESNVEYTTQAEQLKGVMTWALGSQHWAKSFSGTKPIYGILLDMVGAKGAYFPKEEYSRTFAPQLVEKIWSMANSMGYSSFAQVNGGGVTDDHFFVNRSAGIPMVDIINMPPNSANKSFGDHWHTHNDNLDIIDPRTLRAVGQVVLAVLYNENNGDF
ncbi:MAG TPA: M28 family peptidase [Flavilitoribacter sp.]|nr:M28 family peptidase [Flavilitoribacter sp.]HMQ90162.1 M28 family peptidase [Flavilitoribacter sp.]